MQPEVALSIIRALADGVNPITGSAYPETSPYAEPLVLRALFTAVDLLEREVQRERKKERLPANFGKPWSPDEDEQLVMGFETGHALPELARRHMRTQSSIRLRLEKLGKIRPEAQQ